MASPLNIVIIGGSDSAKQLILDLISRPFATVAGAVDSDAGGEVARLAQHTGIPFTTDIRELAGLRPTPDVVIDVCGKPHVNPALRDTFPPEEQGGPVIVHDTIAQLLLSIAANTEDLVPSCAVGPAGRTFGGMAEEAL